MAVVELVVAVAMDIQSAAIRVLRKDNRGHQVVRVEPVITAAPVIMEQVVLRAERGSARQEVRRVVAVVVRVVRQVLRRRQLEALDLVAMRARMEVLAGAVRRVTQVVQETMGRRVVTARMPLRRH